jgi:hypothetical protein
MDATEKRKSFAWQPLTLSGVTAFGDASVTRLLAVQLFFAVLFAGMVVWLLQSCWFPVLRESIRHLPSAGQIQSAKLVWQGDSPVSLGQNRFLAIAVDLKHEGQARSPAHVQIEFGERDVKMISLLGFLKADYPKGWIIPFNQQSLQPWWGAWSPILLAIAGLAVGLGLFLFWAVVALVLCVPVWVVALFEDRALTLPGAWRLAGAAQLPGTLLLIVALFFYGMRLVDPVKLLAAAAVHILLILIYGLGSPFCRPKVIEKTGNPFETKPRSGSPPQPENPFGSANPIASGLHSDTGSASTATPTEDQHQINPPQNQNLPLSSATDQDDHSGL